MNDEYINSVYIDQVTDSWGKLVQITVKAGLLSMG